MLKVTDFFLFALLILYRSIEQIFHKIVFFSYHSLAVEKSPKSFVSFIIYIDNYVCIK